MGRGKEKNREQEPASASTRSGRDDVPEDEFPADVDGALMTAVELHQQGQLTGAEEIYKKILLVDPEHADCLYLLGVIARERGKYEAAARWIHKAIRIHPQNAVFYHELGCGYQDQGNLDKAISCYEKALQLEPNDADLLYNMGNALKEDGRPDEAIAYYGRALEIKPNDPGTYNNMGVSFRDKGDPDEAIACFRKALRSEPDYAAALINMGMAFQEKGEAEEAISLFQRGIALDPENVSARYLLASLTGQTPQTAPRQYVAALFDAYSKRFDQHLVEELAYETPRLLRQSLNRLVNNDLRFRNAIDLGCGTGLSGAEFRTISDCLWGVDVSLRMVEQAREKGIYDLLHVDDIVEFLNGTDKAFDLFIATDVFPYLGDLKPLFGSVQKRTSGQAYFVFSTETCDGLSYVLQETGRYAHSVSYIQSLVEQHGFAVKANQTAVIRKDRGQSIVGNQFILRHMG